MAGCDLAETRCATLFRANSPCDIVICWTLGAHGHARELGSVYCCYRGPENPIFHRTSSTSDVVVIIQFRASRGVELLQRASPALANECGHILSNLSHHCTISHPHRVHLFSFLIPISIPIPNATSCCMLPVFHPPVPSLSTNTRAHDGGGVCWVLAYVASEAHRTPFCRAIHHTSPAFKHCGIVAGLCESESPLPTMRSFPRRGRLSHRVARCNPDTTPSAPRRHRWPRPPAIRVPPILLANRG